MRNSQYVKTFSSQWRDQNHDATILDGVAPLQCQAPNQVVVLPQGAFGEGIADHLPSVVHIPAPLVWWK